MKLRTWFLLLPWIVLLSGCLAEEVKKSVEQSLTTSWFNGVKAAQNLGGSPASVKVTWDAPLQTVSAYRIYAVQQSTDGTAWELLDEVLPSTTSYIHSGLISGNLYTYRVRAVDVSGQEEKNNHTAGTVAFEGIADAVILGPTSAQIRINSSYGSFDELRVYGEPKTGGTKTLLGRIQGSSVSLDVTGLRTGTTYKFSVQAYVGFLGNEDGNNVYIEKSMPSESFGSGAAGEGMDKYAYRGFMSIQAYGNAPTGPIDDLILRRNPRTRLARLTWVPFGNSNGQTTYRLFRAISGRNFDVSITGACSPTTETTCVVCTIQGSGPQTCEDSALPNFDPLIEKKKFMYMVSLVKKDSITGQSYVENLPPENSADFQVAVSLPPDNMALVQRDAVNYEMCQIMNRTSDPRKNQRCPFNGMGAVPKNSGPGKPDLNLNTAYYDFGYNLFSDRWALMCNWTRGTDGGKCGSGGSTGDCYGFGDETYNPATDPAFASVGDVGNVYQYHGSGNRILCLIKTLSGWRRLESNGNGSTMTRAEIARIATEVPAADGLSGLISNTPVVTGNEICTTKENAYGNKRVPRRRELVAATGIPWMQGEPFSLPTYEARLRLQAGSDGVGPGRRQCLPNGTDVAGAFAKPSAANLLDAMNVLVSTAFKRLLVVVGGIEYGISEVTPGSFYTAACVSRFGLALRPESLAISDSMIRQDNMGGYFDYLAITSPYDSGNTDLAGYRFNGQRGWSATGDGVQANIATGANAAASGGIAFTSWNVPLGLPIVQKTNSLEDVTPLADFLATGLNYGHSLNSHSSTSAAPAVGSIAVLGQVYRWGLYWRRVDNWTRTRCVQEAE